MIENLIYNLSYKTKLFIRVKISASRTLFSLLFYFTFNKWNGRTGTVLHYLKFEYLSMIKMLFIREWLKKIKL